MIQLSALDLSREIAARALSPVDLMRASLARIDAVNGAVNAVISLRDREALMGEARLAEAMAPRGWLHGIPVAVKDLVAVKGVRSTSGSPLFAEFVPKVDDGLVRRLRAAGAIIIGKTNVPEFGLGSHSTNPLFGVTRNPFDPTRTAGGSSGGAAAALKMGMVSVADGSDMMGSLRNPAAWCDVYGFRPSVGLVPGEAREAAFLHRLSTNGPMARHVGDLEAMLSTLCDGAYASGAAPRSPRIAWLGDWGGAYAMEDGLLAAGDAALRRTEALGWRVEAVAPPVPAAVLWEAWTTLRSFAVMMSLAPHWPVAAERALLNAQAQWEVSRGMALRGEGIATAMARRMTWLAAADALFQRYDAIALPSTQVWPFPAEWTWPQEIAGQGMDTYHRWMECVIPASLGGFPAINLPGGLGPGGLPHGVQLIAKPGGDAQILALARAYEAMIGPREVGAAALGGAI